MVGVPGKSEGCNTCRRRKVGCDKGKPFCERCKASGRQCEGYERYPVFMITTQDGMQPRKRLEEAKPLVVIGGRSSSPSNVNATRTAPRRSISPSSNAIWHTKLAGIFWNSITTKNARFNNDSALIWLREALQLPTPSEALKLSLAALCTMRAAWTNKDEELAMHGRKVYGQALRSIQKALNDPKLMYDDHTFGAARTLMFYEFYQPTSNDPSAWKQHINGLALLIKARGPTRYKSAFARAALEDARDSMMIQSLMERRHCFLGEPEWLNKPWSDSNKDARQVVCDIGFAIGALIQEFDRTSKTDLNAQLSLLKRFLRVNQTIKSHNLENYDATGYGKELEFSDIQSAIATMHALALKEGLYTIVDPLRAMIWARTEVHRDPQALQLLSLAETQFSDSVMHETSRKILASVRFCLREDVSAVGSRRVVFPLAAALYQLTSTNAPELAECKLIYRDLTAKRGIGLAKNIGRGISSRVDDLNRRGPTGLTTGS